jgi:hypothetical protein
LADGWFGWWLVWLMVGLADGWFDWCLVSSIFMFVCWFSCILSIRWSKDHYNYNVFED